jgi:hypothetical protein
VIDTYQQKSPSPTDGVWCIIVPCERVMCRDCVAGRDRYRTYYIHDTNNKKVHHLLMEFGGYESGQYCTMAAPYDRMHHSTIYIIVCEQRVMCGLCGDVR